MLASAGGDSIPEYSPDLFQHFPGNEELAAFNKPAEEQPPAEKPAPSAPGKLGDRLAAFNKPAEEKPAPERPAPSAPGKLGDRLAAFNKPAEEKPPPERPAPSAPGKLGDRLAAFNKPAEERPPPERPPPRVGGGGGLADRIAMIGAIGPMGMPMGAPMFGARPSSMARARAPAAPAGGAPAPEENDAITASADESAQPSRPAPTVVRRAARRGGRPPTALQNLQ